MNKHSYIENGPKMFFFVQQLIASFNNHFRAVCAPLGESTTTTKMCKRSIDRKLCVKVAVEKTKLLDLALSFLCYTKFDIFLSKSRDEVETAAKEVSEVNKKNINNHKKSFQ